MSRLPKATMEPENKRIGTHGLQPKPTQKKKPKHLFVINNHALVTPNCHNAGILVAFKWVQ